MIVRLHVHVNITSKSPTHHVISKRLNLITLRVPKFKIFTLKIWNFILTMGEQYKITIISQNIKVSDTINKQTSIVNRTK